MRRRWEIWLLATIVALVSALALYAYGARAFTRISSPDAMRYASVARAYLRGEGFAWRQYLPYELATEGYNPDKRYPHFLHPLAIAAAMTLLGERDAAVALASAVPTVLAALLVFALGRRWFDARVGLVAALAFALGADTLYYGLSGLTEPLFTVVLLIVAACYVAGLRRGGWTAAAWMAGAGAALGLGQAVRPVGVLYALPFALVALIAKGPRWRRAGAFLAGFAALFALTTWVGAGRFLPVGDPSYGLLTGIGEFREKYDFHRMLAVPPDPWAYVFAHRGDFWAKVQASARHYVKDILPVLGSGNAVVGALFAASWLVRYHDDALNKVRLLVLLLMAAQLGVNLLLWPTDRYFFPFLPFVILFAGDYLWRIVDTLRALAEKERVQQP